MMGRAPKSVTVTRSLLVISFIGTVYPLHGKVKPRGKNNAIEIDI